MEGDSAPDGVADGGRARGVLPLPSGSRAVAQLYAIQYGDEDRPAWICVGVPPSALARTERRIGSFPFGDAGGGGSLAWRIPLDLWLMDVARVMARSAPVQLAAVGFELGYDEIDGLGPVIGRPLRTSSWLPADPPATGQAVGTSAARIAPRTPLT